MYLKKIAAFSLFSLIAFQVFAEGACLDKVVFSVSAKEWVQTDKARLHVRVNGTLNEGAVAEVRADIMKKLQAISPGEWHITQFNRFEDNSGLNKLTVDAVITLPQSNLNTIYEKAKAVSKAGMMYVVSDIDFNPTDEDIERTKMALRARLYDSVNAELKRLNTAFPEQHYTVNRLYFMPLDEPIPVVGLKKENMAVTLARAPASLVVSNESSLKAVVEFASNRVVGDSSAHS